MGVRLSKDSVLWWTVVLGFSCLASCAPLTPYDGAEESSDGGGDLQEKAATQCASGNENQSVTLSCASGSTIASITFASYGNPSGSCESGYSSGTCNAPNSLEKVQAACVGRQSCTVAASNDVFDDVCAGVSKRLAVSYVCSSGPSSESMPVFLMAGQSNMVGNVDASLFDGLLNELTSGSSSTTQSRLKHRLYDWYMNNDGGYASYGYSDAIATLESAELIRMKNAGLVGSFLKSPLSDVMCTMNSNQVSGLTTNCGSIFGPELGLGHYLKSKGYTPTSLIKVAQGGTTLFKDWRSPKTVAQSGGSVGPLYTQLQSRIDSLRSNPASVHARCATNSCRWGGFIWFQGENDSMGQAEANAYEKNLTNLIADVRGRVGSSTLPVVIVEIGPWAQTLDFGKTVRSAQGAVVSADAKTRLVKTSDLSGFFHFDPAAQLIIGERVGIALSGMLGTSVDNCPNDPNKTEPGQCGCGIPEGTCGGGSGDMMCVKAKESTTASLSCPSGQTIKAISFASYGNPTGACPNVVKGTCHASTSLSKVQALCLNKQACSVAAKNKVFGDPCSGVGKKLAIKYTCSGGGNVDNCPNDPNKTEPGLCGCGVADTDTDRDGTADCRDGCANDASKTEPGLCGCGVPEGTCTTSEAKCASADENATAALSCNVGQIIKTISFASYGSPTGTCPNVAQGSCHDSNSLSKVQSLCLNKQSCSVGANNDVFVDQCGGVSKRLAVKYTCSTGTADTTATKNALTALNNHLKGTSVLSAAQIAAQKSVIDSNLRDLGANSATVSMAFDLVATYESVHGPLFMNAANANMSGADWNPGFDRTALRNDIHMAILGVMQGLVDYGYAGQNVSLYESALAGRKFKSSEYFPGKVTSTPNPSTVHTATIKADYPRAWGHPVMNDLIEFARRPTGTYLAPGSIATVTVPQALVSRGFQIRVGAHAEDYSKSNQFIRRLDRVSIVFPIRSTVTKIGNPLGGGVYIDVPLAANAGVVTVQIQNVVRAPYYSMTSLRRTTLSEWQSTERNFGAPWADFQTDKFMVQLPTSWINKFTDPSSFLTFWDSALDVVSDLMGFPRLRNKEVLYMVPDRSWRYGVGAPGYPSSNMLYLPQEGPFSGNEQNSVTMGPAALYDEGFQTELHELGHGQLFQKLSESDTEAAVEVLAVAIANRKFGKSMDEAHRLGVSALSLPRDKASFLTLPNTAVEWMTCENFKLGKYMTYEESQYQLKGSAKYVQLADLLGWSVLDSFWRSINQDHEAGVKVDTSTNGLILRMSKAAGADVAPLLHFWGNMPTDVASMKAATAAANIPRSSKVYDRLMQYKSSVPDDNQAFRTFAQSWWGKQPSGGGGVTESYHAQLWSSYNESYAALLRSNVQKIIDSYFPNGRP